MQGSVEVEEPSAGSRGRVFSDVDALFALRALPGPYLPWGSGSMRPAGLVEVCNDMVLNDRRHIVELGSGVSTVMLARLLAQRVARASAGWSPWSTTRVGAAGSSGSWSPRALARTFSWWRRRLRPLADGGGSPWYDEAAIDAAVDVIDLLVVDGPPAYQPGFGLARHRALAVLHDRLVPGATVVLDDIERAGEQEVLRRWEDELGVEFRRIIEAGVAIADQRRDGSADQWPAMSDRAATSSEAVRSLRG